MNRFNAKWFAGLLMLGCLANPITAQDQMQVEDFDSIELYTLENQSGAKVQITNFGAIVTSIVVPDRDGKLGGCRIRVRLC